MDNNSRPIDRQGSMVLSDDGFEGFEDEGPELKEEEARKTVEEIEKEKEQEEIHNSLRGIKTLREINEAFAAVVDPQTGQNAGTGTQSALSEYIREDSYKEIKTKTHIPLTKRYFERFFQIKLEIREKDHMALLKEQFGKTSNSRFLSSVKKEMVYSMDSCTDQRLKLFLGEGGSLYQIHPWQVTYQGGFMGNAFNIKLASFALNHKTELGVEYKGINIDNNVHHLGRMGNLTFFDRSSNHLIIFGGQKMGDKFKKSSARLISNDIIIYDVYNHKVLDYIEYSEAAVPARMYASGFKIDQKIFVIGGMGGNGQLLVSFKELDYKRKYHEDAIVDHGMGLLERLYSSAIVGVFYPCKSKNSDEMEISLKMMADDPNWGDTTELIKHEGFYMFGGRRTSNEASDRLLIFKVSLDKVIERARFRIIKPKTLGMGPPARYMHTMSYVPAVNLVCIYGGRNDMLPDNVIMSDLWALKLHNMEWVRMRIGGHAIPNPRSNHCMTTFESKLLIFGGQGRDFNLTKDILSIELDQTKVMQMTSIVDRIRHSLSLDKKLRSSTFVSKKTSPKNRAAERKSTKHVLP